MANPSLTSNSKTKRIDEALECLASKDFSRAALEFQVAVDVALLDERMFGCIDLTKDEAAAQTVAEALARIRDAAGSGNAAAQFEFGRINVIGWAIPRDCQTAVRWFAKAAEQGEVNAQACLGAMHFSGYEGARLNQGTASKWYRLAAGQGHAGAQLSLGDLLTAARGTKQDYESAAKWYRLAVAQGNTDAMLQLGSLYAQALGVSQSSVIGYALAQYSLPTGSVDHEFSIVAAYQVRADLMRYLSAEVEAEGNALLAQMAKYGPLEAIDAYLEANSLN